MEWVRRTSLIVMLGLVATLLAPSAPALAGETLVISTIEKKVKKITKRFQPMADYLAEVLSGHGVDAVEIFVATDKSSLIEGLKAGDIDVYFDSPLIMAEIMKEAPLRPELRRWKKGVAEYHSVFFARQNSGIATLDDLPDRRVAFERDFSTSGYLLPKSDLLKRGYKVAALDSREASVPPGEIGYIFSNDDANTVFWVLQGSVAAGVVDSETYRKVTTTRPNAFRIIGESESVPRNVIGYRSGLDPAIAQALTEQLLNMHVSDAGKAVLESSKTTRFDRFPDGAELTFARMSQILTRLSDG
jgi:phosphonate transport system substrate-binding protein